MIEENKVKKPTILIKIQINGDRHYLSIDIIV